MYLANPCSPETVTAMQAGTIGYIDTPAQGNKRPEGVAWCADNAATCLFAVAPDVVGDALATTIKSRPWLARIRALGYPVAYVAQDGLENLRGRTVSGGLTFPVPWDSFDVLFIGGTTEWKLGPVARDLVAEAKSRGKWVHMGRVNSERRFEYARAIGCDSADGTYLTFGPDTNLPKLLAWTRNNNQGGLF
jgi:hypothetical protein